MNTTEILRSFTSKFPEMDASVRNEQHVEFKVPADKIHDVVSFIDQTFQEILPESAFGVDLGEDKYEVHYMFWSHIDKVVIQLRVHLEGENPEIQSCCQIFPGLEWHERETHEMFGINFIGHPDLRPLLLPDELVGKYPLRKSFQTDRSRVAKTDLTPKTPKPEGGASE